MEAATPPSRHRSTDESTSSQAVSTSHKRRLARLMAKRQRARWVSRERGQQWLYLLLDFLASYGVWVFFVLWRREFIEHQYRPLDAQQFVNGAIIGVYWAITYGIAGLYSRPLRRSRMQEILQVGKYTLIGVLVIFFLVFLDDSTTVPGYEQRYYHLTLTTYFALQFGVVAVGRFLLTTRTQILIRRRKIRFATLIVGCGQRAYRIWDELEHARRSFGYDFKGFVSIDDDGENYFWEKLKSLGTLDRLHHAILSRQVQEVIIALESSELNRIGDVIEVCEQANVRIKVVPGVYDYLTGSVKVSHILGEPLIEVFPQIMKPWEIVAKRAFDLAFAVVALLLLVPVYVVLAILIKLDSPGPVLFRQERIGRGGRPFYIYKFRSMRQDAEKFGPALSRENDPRITRVGRVLRKLRLDELPQFWNVLVGDMSIVGPRPERRFYIEQIVKEAPHYRHLHKIRPGITSWGQVKYGYAENVEQMVKRLRFDILYLENMSFALDLRIILYTLIVMIEGRGK